MVKFAIGASLGVVCRYNVTRNCCNIYGFRKCYAKIFNKSSAGYGTRSIIIITTTTIIRQLVTAYVDIAIPES